MTNLLVVDNAIIDSLMANSAILADIPCLLASRNAVAAAGCGSCSRRKNRITYSTDYGKAKACLASLGTTAKNKIKTFLNARQLRVVVARNGRLDQLTF